LADLNADRRMEYIFTYGDMLIVYTHDKQLSFQHTFKGNLSAACVLPVADGGALIAVAMEDKEEVRVLNNLGDELPNMPLFGSHAVLIDDINNDGTLNLITSHPEGKIFTYSLR